MVGITGSAGKTTVTTLLGMMAGNSAKYPAVWVGGNIGNPLLADVERMGVDDLAIMEVSSHHAQQSGDGSFAGAAGNAYRAARCWRMLNAWVWMIWRSWKFQAFSWS